MKLLGEEEVRVLHACCSSLSLPLLNVVEGNIQNKKFLDHHDNATDYRVLFQRQDKDTTFAALFSLLERLEYFPLRTSEIVWKQKVSLSLSNEEEDKKPTLPVLQMKANEKEVQRLEGRDDSFSQSLLL